MRRGTRVGQAYVAVTADGSGINDDIVNSLDDAGDDIDRKGKEHGEGYGDHFSEGFFDRVSRKLTAGFNNKINADLEKSGNEGGQHFSKGLTSSFGDLREKVSGELDQVLDRMKTLRGQLDRSRSQNSIDRLTISLKESRAEATRLTGQLRSLAATEARVAAQITKSRATAGGGIGDGRSDLGGLVGGLLGAGSRNNALNLLGKSIGGLTTGFQKLFSVLGNTGPVKTISNALGDLIEKTTFLEKIGAMGGGAVGQGLAAVASTGPGAVIALVAVSAGMVVMVSVATALLGVLTALASTIAGALVGALSVAAVGFGALAGAVGLTTLAFMSMTDAQKKSLSTAFKPVHEAAIGLGQVMLRDLVPAFDTWGKAVGRALSLLGPLASVMGGALARAGTIFTQSLSGPGVQQFIDALTRMLPAITVNFSRAFGNLLNGIGSVFAAITPYLLQFSNWLSDVTGRFARFAASTKGQNAISDFVARAVASLQSLMNFLGAVGGLITKVLFNPDVQATGDNIFDRMANSLRKFTNFLSQDNRLAKWMQEADRFATTLGDTIRSVAIVLANLNSSGVLTGLAKIASGAEKATTAFNKMPTFVKDMLLPIRGVIRIMELGITTTTRFFGTFVLGVGHLLEALQAVGNAGSHLPFVGSKFRDLANAAGAAAGTVNALGNQILALPNKTVVITVELRQRIVKSIVTGAVAGAVAQPKQPAAPKLPSLNLSGLGASALANTSKGGGGGGGGGGGKGAAAAIHKTAKQIRAALKELFNEVSKGLRDIEKATSGGEVQNSINDIIKSMRDAGKELDKQARRRIAAATQILAAQKKINQSRVADLLNGGPIPKGATLAELAVARGVVATRLEAANARLAEAISIRDDYRKQVTDAVKSFGEITTAVASQINGVEQALTAGDITTNLQQRLDKIRHFQESLRVLLAQGLSQAAYKQIVDAGVETGTTYADALIAGGTGAIQQTNSLVQGINDIADSLGIETSNRMYQAGVDAAQGLVDGLKSLSAQLDAAAVALGNSIALSIKRALGIKSPSRVLMGMMDYVGDGAVIGLDNQHTKVGLAADRFASRIAVSPEVALYASRQNAQPVSGNEVVPAIGSLTVVTPTEDPHAVANEVLNEVTGRL